jgi:transposase
MYLRSVKTSYRGTTREYLRLVEAYREDGKVKQRVVCTLGRKDLLTEHLPALLKRLQGESSSTQGSVSEKLQALGAFDWGPSLVVRELFSQLGLWEILDSFDKGRSHGRGRFADRVFALVANRLCCPTSEHGLARWLETDFVCDRMGRRWTPQWRCDEERLKSSRPRVRVESLQLSAWYRTLDMLERSKSGIEKALFLRLRTLFSLKAELVFYDLTSTYFAGRGPVGLARHGHSRDGHPRDRQVLLGLVMIDGWPVAHHVLAGNRRDSTTVPEVVEDVRKRFGIARMVFVGDRGMATLSNVALLRKAHQGYLVGLNRRRSERIYRYIESATGAWLECPVGVAASERSTPPKTLVQEVPSEEPGVRVFVVQSDDRLAYETSQREAAMKRVKDALEALRLRVERGKLKAPEKIGSAAGRILSRRHGDRYFAWELANGVFRHFEHPVNFRREKAYEGKYVIQTEEAGLSPVEAVQHYKELSEVERAFSRLKDVIEMRPIFHKTDSRVQAHIFVAALAFLIDRALEKKLKAAKVDLSSREAWQALKTIRVVDFALGNGQTKRSVTRGSERLAPILRAIPIENLDPPRPPKGQEAVV